jgi:hypothetical protein
MSDLHYPSNLSSNIRHFNKTSSKTAPSEVVDIVAIGVFIFSKRGSINQIFAEFAVNTCGNDIVLVFIDFSGTAILDLIAPAVAENSVGAAHGLDVFHIKHFGDGIEELFFASDICFQVFDSADSDLGGDAVGVKSKNDVLKT